MGSEEVREEWREGVRERGTREGEKKWSGRGEGGFDSGWRYLGLMGCSCLGKLSERVFCRSGD